ncbi:hypothetical protein [Naasia aerilata]|nr:hypothetical protein [Naasia aerilata]
MSALTAGPAASSRRSDPNCPNCEQPLRKQGDGDSHYWSCKDCNLVFLV